MPSSPPMGAAVCVHLTLMQAVGPHMGAPKGRLAGRRSGSKQGLKAGAQPRVVEAPALVRDPSRTPGQDGPSFLSLTCSRHYMSACDRGGATDTTSTEAGSGAPPALALCPHPSHGLTTRPVASTQLPSDR